LREKIMIVEDEEKIRRIIKDYLSDEGFETDECENGTEAFEIFCSGGYKLLILDWMIPGMSGIELCREIRNISDVPIIMLTAKNMDEDQIKGFEYGADEYITKPFNPSLLVKRVEAVIKRCYPHKEEFVKGDILVDFASARVFSDAKEIKLTPKEYELLKYFVGNPGIILSREKILDNVWGFDYTGDCRTVDSHVRSLRRKLGNDIVNILRSLGYRFEVNF